jgi:hypothetical protein
VIRWLFPTLGDVLAVATLGLIASAIAWGLLAERRDRRR